MTEASHKFVFLTSVFAVFIDLDPFAIVTLVLTGLAVLVMVILLFRAACHACTRNTATPHPHPRLLNMAYSANINSQPELCCPRQQSAHNNRAFEHDENDMYFRPNWRKEAQFENEADSRILRHGHVRNTSSVAGVHATKVTCGQNENVRHLTSRSKVADPDLEVFTHPVVFIGKNNVTEIPEHHSVPDVCPKRQQDYPNVSLVADHDHVSGYEGGENSNNLPKERIGTQCPATEMNPSTHVFTSEADELGQTGTRIGPTNQSLRSKDTITTGNPPNCTPVGCARTEEPSVVLERVLQIPPPPLIPEFTKIFQNPRTSEELSGSSRFDYSLGRQSALLDIVQVTPTSTLSRTGSLGDLERKISSDRHQGTHVEEPMKDGAGRLLMSSHL